VFEGIKAYWNADQGQLHVFRLDAHLKRLYDSMKIVRMAPPYTPADLAEAALMVLRANDIRHDTYLRPVAFYDGVKLPSFRYTVGAAPDICLSTMAFHTHLLEQKAKACTISSWTRLSDNQSPPRVKVMSNYQNNRLAFVEAFTDGYDDAIMLDERGKVTEATGACLFLVRDGVLTTPRVTDGILESVTRDVVIRVCREVLGLVVEEREIDRTELYACEEVFLCGTGEEVTAVTSIDRLPVADGSPGPVFLAVEMFLAVERLYHDLVRGMDSRYPEWRTSVYPATP